MPRDSASPTKLEEPQGVELGDYLSQAAPAPAPAGAPDPVSDVEASDYDTVETCERVTAQVGCAPFLVIGHFSEEQQ